MTLKIENNIRRLIPIIVFVAITYFSMFESYSDIEKSEIRNTFINLSGVMLGFVLTIKFFFASIDITNPVIKYIRNETFKPNYSYYELFVKLLFNTTIFWGVGLSILIISVFIGNNGIDLILSISCGLFSYTLLTTFVIISLVKEALLRKPFTN